MPNRAWCVLPFLAFCFACDSTGSPPDAGLPTCTAPTGAGTTHSTVTVDETWLADASPHVLTGTFFIPEGVTVTVQACATVQLGDSANVSISGQLRTQGTQGRPVVFTRLDAAKPWGFLDAAGTKAKPAIDLTWTRLEGGGKPTSADLENSSMLRVRAARDTGGEAMLAVDNVELRGSSSVGIELADSATFTPGSQQLTVTGSASAPVRLNGWALSNLPTGDYAGNAVDAILLNTAERLGITGATATVVMRARNVPYRVGVFGNPFVLTLGAPSGQAITTLRVEAGATVAFQKDTGITVASVGGQSSGALIIEGTPAAPVTLTSAQTPQAAGDWRGILFNAPPTADTLLDRVVIQYAGSTNSQSNGFSCGTEPAASKLSIVGALAFATDGEVTRQVLTNSTIRDSATNGVDRGWRGAAVDYLATNTFERVAFCRQTAPRPATGQCAVPAPCE